MAAYISQREAQYLWVDMEESLPVAFHRMRELFSMRKRSPILPPSYQTSIHGEIW